MKILITGASGFVGSSFVNQYENQKDIEIIGIGRRKLNKENYFQMDLTLPFNLDYKPDVVIHAAAKASPWGSKEEFYRQNVTATQNVIDFCIKKQVPKLIYISSSSVYYNDKDQLNITETTTIGPNFINEYANTKYLGELLVQKYPQKWVILRPRAVFGPGDTVLFPRILEAAKKKSLPIITREPSPAIGDLIYIENLIHYMHQAAKKEDICGDYNLTNNEPVEIQSFLFGIFQKLNIPLPTYRISYHHALIAAGLVEGVYKFFQSNSEPPITKFGIHVFGLSKTFNVSKMIETMGKPPISIEEGVQKFIQWQANQ